MAYRDFLNQKKHTKPLIRILVFSICISFTNCSVSNKNSNLNKNTMYKNYKRQWMLISFQDFERNFLIKSKAELNLSRVGENMGYTAYMGCNNLSGQVEINENGTIKFGESMATMSYCEETMKLERNFSEALSQVTKYEIKGHRMTLKDNYGNEMKFIAADWD